MTERSKTLTVVERYEPDEERQVAAILLVLSRATRGRSVETMSVPTEAYRLQLGTRGGTLNQSSTNDAAVIEETINDDSTHSSASSNESRQASLPLPPL